MSEKKAAVSYKTKRVTVAARNQQKLQPIQSGHGCAAACKELIKEKKKQSLLLMCLSLPELCRTRRGKKRENGRQPMGAIGPREGGKIQKPTTQPPQTKKIKETGQFI